jgi:hypothetical protein
MGNDPQSRATGNRCVLFFGPVYDPLPTGFGIGWPLGGPSVAQGPPKRGAREAQASIQESALVATKVEKWRVGDWNGLDADVARMDADQEESNRNQQSYLRSTRQEGY